MWLMQRLNLVDERGTLIPPNDPRLIRKCKDSDIAAEYEISDDTLLFASTQTLTQSEIKSFLINNNEHEFPCTFETHSSTATKVLKKGQKVHAKRVDGFPEIYYVEPFNDVGEKRDGMPETGQEIEVDSDGARGFVRKSALKTSLIESIFPAFQPYPTNAPIFRSNNLIDDIKQNNFGDCFLLASIIAILAKPDGSDYIKSMMRQSDCGRYVTVRLFDPNTKLPIFYRIPNTYYSKYLRSQVTHLSPWVHILEKAYVLHAFRHRNPIEGENKYVSDFPSFRNMFGSGGLPSTAMIVLTGKESADTNIPGYNPPEDLILDQSNLNECYLLYLKTSAFVDELTPENLQQLDFHLDEIWKQDNARIESLLAIISPLNDLNSPDAIEQLENCFSGESYSYLWLHSIIKNSLEDELIRRALHAYLYNYVRKNKQPDLDPFHTVLPNLNSRIELGKAVEDVHTNHAHGASTSSAVSQESRLSLEEIGQILNEFRRKHYHLAPAAVDAITEHTESLLNPSNTPFESRHAPSILTPKKREFWEKLETGEQFVATTKNRFDDENNYKLALLPHTRIELEQGNIYISLHKNKLRYTMLTPDHQIIENELLDGITPPEPFNLQNLQKLKDAILQITKANGHSRKVKGLYPRHAYAITGIEDMNGEKYIYLANPWGTHGMLVLEGDAHRQAVMTDQSITVEDKKSGSLKIPYDVFCKHFAYITSGQVPGVAEYAPMQLAEPNLTLPSPPSTPENTNSTRSTLSTDPRYLSDNQHQYNHQPFNHTSRGYSTKQPSFFQRHKGKITGTSFGIALPLILGGLIIALSIVAPYVGIPLTLAIGITAGLVLLGGGTGFGLGMLVDNGVDNPVNQGYVHLPVETGSTAVIQDRIEQSRNVNTHPAELVLSPAQPIQTNDTHGCGDETQPILICKSYQPKTFGFSTSSSDSDTDDVAAPKKYSRSLEY